MSKGWSLRAADSSRCTTGQMVSSPARSWSSHRCSMRCRCSCSSSLTPAAEDRAIRHGRPSRKRRTSSIRTVSTGLAAGRTRRGRGTRRSEVAGSAPPGGGRPVLLIGSGHPARPGCRAARNAASLNLTMTLPAGAKASQARSGAPALADRPRPRLQDGPQHSSVFGPPDGSPEPNRGPTAVTDASRWRCVARDAPALSGLRNHVTKG